MLDRDSAVPPPRKGPDREGGRVKGTLIAARLRFLRAKGPDALERVLDGLDAADQAALRGMILPSSWYPADLLKRLEASAVSAVSGGDTRALFLEMGRFTAQTNLGEKGVQRAYLRPDDPHFLLSNVPRMYVTQHTAGNRTCEKRGEKAAVIRSYDEAPPRPEECLTTTGWLQRAIELAGGREAHVVEKLCRAKGSPHCEFHCTWG